MNGWKSALFFGICRLALVALALLVTGGCGGGSGSSAPSVTVTAKDAVQLASPYDLAVVGEKYQEPIQAISTTSDLTITGFRIAETTPPATGTTTKAVGFFKQLFSLSGQTLPTIDSSGLITWTPTEADAGIRYFQVTVTVGNGTEASISFPIEVAKRIPLISVTVGNEGGTFTDDGGEYSLLIPANAVEKGKSAITASISVVRRADGREAVDENVSNVNVDVGYRLVKPLRPAPDASLTPPGSAKATAKTATLLSSSGLIPMEQYKGSYFNRSFSAIRDNGYGQPISDVYGGIGLNLADDGSGDDNIAVLDGSCAKEDGSCNGKQGVIFVHGYTPNNSFGGGTSGGTWGETFTFTKSLPNVAVYEFKWKTNARFEEQAYYLSRAVKRVVTITGIKPIVVAHSFGGVLVSTYVTGNAEKFIRSALVRPGESYVPKAVPIPYGNDIAEVITIGSPLSGIYDFSSDNYYNMVYGRDMDDLIISQCGQMSCAEAGYGGSPNHAVPGGRIYYGIKEFAGTMSTDAYNAYKLKGITPQLPGSTINAMHKAWLNGVANPPRIKVLVGCKSSGSSLSGSDVNKRGDGLISLMGQALLPVHFTGYDPGSGGSWISPKSQMPNLTYYFMADYLMRQSNSSYRSSMFGFTHTSSQLWALQDKFRSYNTTEVSLPQGDGRVVSGSDVNFEHPLATCIKAAVYAGAEPYGKGTTTLKSTVNGKVQEKSRKSKKSFFSTPAPSTGAPFPFVFTVSKVTATGLEQIFRKDGFTDGNGQLSLNVERVLALEDSVPTTDLRIMLVVGNSAVHVPKTIAIDSWSELLDIGVIELERRDSLPTKAALSGSLTDSNAGGAAIPGALVKLKMGDNLPVGDFASLADSSTSRSAATDASGNFTVTDLLPGRYTVLIAKAGYTPARRVFDLPDSGAAIAIDMASTTVATYTLSHDTWTPMSAVGAPLPRLGATAIWTGKEMIVWGGIGAANTVYGDGARYNPATDRWQAMSTTGAPAKRHWHTAVWTGKEIIVWGGSDQSDIYTSGWVATLKNDGAIYNPATDTWRPISAVGAPSPRTLHRAIWTGTEMIVLGGEDGNYSWNNNGGRYNPVTDTWSPLPLPDTLPLSMGQYALTWTGAEMLVYGYQWSYLPNGAAEKFNPATGSWRGMSVSGSPLASIPIYNATTVWTGKDLLIWGGRYDANSPSGSGGAYNNATDSWRAITTSGAPSPRDYHVAVWTGTEMLIWGGWSGSYLNNGAGYNPMTDSWRPMSTIGIPEITDYPNLAVWTGREMIVWGGGSGSRYTP